MGFLSMALTSMGIPASLRISISVSRLSCAGGGAGASGCGGGALSMVGSGLSGAGGVESEFFACERVGIPVSSAIEEAMKV